MSRSDINVDLHCKVDILQVRKRLLTTVLLIRCGYTILLTFLNDRKGETSASSPNVQVGLSINRMVYEKLIVESHLRDQPRNEFDIFLSEGILSGF